MLLALSGCGRSPEDRPSPREHPVAGYAGPEGESTALVDSTVLPENVSPTAPALIERILGATKVAEFGAVNDTASVFIGYIQDTALRSDGLLAVLDSRAGKVLVIGPDGRLRGTIGRPGPGPDEFEYPETIAFDRNDRLIAVDRDGRVKVLEETTDGAFELSEALQIESGAWDACELNGVLFARASSPETKTTINSFRLDGSLIASFGKRYEIGPELVRSTMSEEGALECHTATETIVSVFHYLPVIVGYSPDGSLKWQSDAPLIADGVVEERPDGSISVSIPEEGGSLVMNATSVDNELLAVSFGNFGSQDYSLALINATNGMGHVMRMPLDFRGIAGDRAYFATNLPYPRIEIHALE